MEGFRIDDQPWCGGFSYYRIIIAIFDSNIAILLSQDVDESLILYSPVFLKAFSRSNRPEKLTWPSEKPMSDD